MLHIPTVVFQSHGQGQLEMSGNCFSAENRISLVQASQRPYKHGYDSQTSSVFEHNYCLLYHVYQAVEEHQPQSWLPHDTS
nr:hypothetical protein Iba_chr09aCG16030 [Ipomoea batatas]GME03668.1 hypothetical protein Iba_scaffold1011.2CG0280 [Ipomoea batatas]